jgi:hypothetical protein
VDLGDSKKEEIPFKTKPNKKLDSKDNKTSSATKKRKN